MNILKEDLACVPGTLPLTYGLMDGTAFFVELHRNRHLTFDVITYSVNPNLHFLRYVRRLIYGVPTSGLSSKKCKFSSSIHTKLYLGYKNARLVKGWVGSQNLVHPTTINIMIELSPRQRRVAAVFFNRIWKTLSCPQSS